MYVWNNRWTADGAKIDLNVENPWGATQPGVEDHIKAERDYYNAVSASAQISPTSPFDGTKGMGYGTLANRPPTCVTNPLESGGGVGYFATDDGPNGTLYRCSATNTWTKHYQPFVYPHPLQTSCTTDKECAPPGECQSAKCDSSAGLCSTTPLPDGTACSGGVCEAGGCKTSADGGVGGFPGTGGAAPGGTGGAAPGGGAGLGAAGGQGGKSTDESDGGCGCRTTEGGLAARGFPWLAMALLVVFRRARRSRDARQ
jgi:MYXO-CTERM domain-containing protein